MESNSASQVPNGSVGVHARPPEPSVHNGGGSSAETGFEPTAEPATAPSIEGGRTSLAGQGVGQHDSPGPSIAAPPLRPGWSAPHVDIPPRLSALVRQATGRPVGLGELLRSLREPAPKRLETTSREDERELGYSVVVIERDDSLPAICGKLDAAPLPAVAMLVPHGNAELSTEIGARLLLRHADWAGKEIVLVTRRPALRQVAHAEGLRYVGSLQRVPFARRSGTRPLLAGLEVPIPALSSVAWLAGGFVALAAAIFAVFWYLPSATVTLFPPTTPISQDQSLNLDVVANRVDPVNNVVPADRRSVTVTRTVLIPATGTASVEQTVGDPTTAPAVSDADLKTAQDMAPAALTDEALQELNRRDSGWMFFPVTAKVDVDSVTPQQKAGAVSPFLQVTYRGSVSMLGAKQSDLRALLLPALRGKLPAGKQLIDSSERLTVEKAGPFDITADRLPLVLRLDAAVAGQTDVAKIGRALRGKSKRQALEYATKAVDGVRRPTVRVSPSWMPWLPHFAGRVHVELSAQS
jgi:hypothetical protein